MPPSISATHPLANEMELRNRKLTDPSATPPTPSRRSRVKRAVLPVWRVTFAWLVHLYTGMGLLVNMYALLHSLILTPDFNLFAKLNWLAILIDATDGTLARAANVKKFASGYDGAMLDNIIDFQTFSLLPSLAVIVFDLVPGQALQAALAGTVLIASGFQFCQTTAKTTEAFVGFPSYWNIVVFYVYYLRTSVPVTVAIFAVCAVLSFIPVHFIYPTRTAEYFHVNIVGAYIWAILMLVPTFFPDSKYVTPALYLSFVYVIYYTAVSFLLDARRRKGEAA